MNKYIKSIFFVALLGLVSCSDDFLTNYPTASQETGGAATEGAILANLTSCYQILLFDSYANNNYNSIVLMSDLRSDDIYKGGGDAGDQGQLYRLSQLDATANELPEGLWTIYFTGLNRSNNALLACENAIGVDDVALNQYKAEAHFLRAYFVHWLWKFWGNIPYFEEELEAPYMAPQYTADQIYAEIMEDLDWALDGDKLPMDVTAENAGRITKAAAMLLRARVVMYQNDMGRFGEVLADMNEIYEKGSYALVDYASIWTRDGEYCDESIFEINHLPGEFGGKTWADGWAGFGTNLPAFISPNGLTGHDLLSESGDEKSIYKGGWGFGPVRPEFVALFEKEDARLSASVNQFATGDYTPRFQDTGYFMGKYAARVEYNEPPGDVDLNYENNLRVFRYAEVLLNAAELMVVHGVAPVGSLTAQDALDQIRSRAGVDPVDASAVNIKLERRREFMGEGMRFWDLVRWGEAAVLTESVPEYSSERTWEDYKKYLPIPQSEIDRTEGEFKLQQNTGY